MAAGPAGRAALKWAACVTALAVLSGCGLPQLSPERRGPAPPAGTKRITKAEDGLKVGDRLMKAGQYQLALDAYYLAGSQHGLTADVLAGIGSANLRLGRLQQAENTLRAALQLDPTYVAALNNLGVVLMNEGKIPEAQETFRRAYALDSGKSDLIRKNLDRAIAKMKSQDYTVSQEPKRYALIRQGDGEYLLQSGQSAGTPDKAAADTASPASSKEK
ncbi:tetratricopeptide repeat protein [Thioclava sp. BHET1]|nr:tetratricopeptide repeat protein [Thioclava sp. BHET1]